MKIGFKKVDEKEQKWIKVSRNIDIFLYWVIMGIVWLVIAFFFFAALYQIVCSLIYKEERNDMFRHVSSAAMWLVVPVSLWLIRKMIDFIQRANILFSPNYVNPHYEKAESFSLREVMGLMQGKPIQWVWDFTFLLFLVSMLGVIISGGSTDIVSSCTLCLILTIMLLTGHFLFRRYYLRRPYEKILVRNSQEYSSIDRPEYFCQRIHQSLKTQLCFCSRQFCFTKDLFLGYTEADTYYHPAAIFREDIQAMEFYILRVNGRVMIDKGILACKLKNGNVVDFYLGSGKTLEGTLKSMDYYCIKYQNNQQPLFTNFGRRD